MSGEVVGLSRRTRVPSRHPRPPVVEPAPAAAMSEAPDVELPAPSPASAGRRRPSRADPRRLLVRTLRFRPDEDVWLAQVAASAAAESAGRAARSGEGHYPYTPGDVIRVLVDRAIAAGLGYPELRADLIREAERVQAVRARRGGGR